MKMGPLRQHNGVKTIPISDLREVASHFVLGGNFVSADRYGSGHINDSFVVNTAIAGRTARHILQRINKHVFRDPESLMENVRRVTEHLRSKSARPDHCLSLLETHEGNCFFVDEEQEYWRVYRFIEGARTVDTALNTRQAREAAFAFGQFQSQMCDLPPPRLHETIADFHNTPARYRQLHRALEEDVCGRAQDCGAEIECALFFEESAGMLAALQDSGDLPLRIAHNDTKLNNVLFDERSGAATCVIDLDTVMPGLALCDFGDLVRTATVSAAEDETNLANVSMRMDYFEALAEGYLGAAAAFLTDAEVRHLAMAGKILTIETGIRFLADYLMGDKYFRIHRPQHNLDRCRTQFALVASIDEQLGAMEEVVSRIVLQQKRNDTVNSE